jgi:hypothetical protein
MITQEEDQRTVTTRARRRARRWEPDTYVIHDR